MIPERFIEDLLYRTDLVDLIDAHVPLKKAGANYAACCPFHNEKSPSFTVSPSKQFYHCFGCGAHGTAIGFMMEYHGLGFVDAVKDLAGRQGLQVPDDPARPATNRPHHPETAPGSEASSGSSPRALAELMGQAAAFYRSALRQSPQAIDYLKQRGLSGEIAARFGIGYAPEGWQSLKAAIPEYDHPDLLAAGLVIENDAGRRYDRFRDRIMFPIITPRGEVIAFGGRVLGAGEPKYLNSPETPLFEKGREVFGLPQARSALREHNTVIVVEGYMDVVALAQHGIGHAVATLGTATTATHIGKLLRQVDQIAFCFDGDAAGRKAAWRALENSLDSLPDHKRIGFVFLPDGHDPDSLVRLEGQEAFLRRIAQATPLSETLINQLSAHCDLSSAEGRAQLVATAKPLLERLRAPLLRLQLVKLLAQRSGLTQIEVERLCQLRPIAPPAPARAPTQAPATTFLRKLLRMLLARPQLALKLPMDQLPPQAPESAAIHRWCETVRSLTDAQDPEAKLPSTAILLQRLRLSGDEPLLEQAAGELMSAALDDTQIDNEFAEALEKLARDRSDQERQSLMDKARRLGSTGLTPDEKQRLMALVVQSKSQPDKL